MSIPIEYAIPTAIDALRRLGVDPPDRAVRALAVRHAVGELSGQDEEMRLRDALTAGEITPDTAEQYVRDAALRQVVTAQAAQLGQTLVRPAMEQARQAFRQEADRVLTDLAAAFNPAAQAVTAAGDHVDARVTAQQVLDRGDDAIHAYRTAAEHSTTLGAIRNAVDQLANLGALPRFTHPSALYLATAPNLDSLEAADVYIREPDPWLRLVGLGYQLRLNTISDAQAVIDGATAATRAERDATQAARAEALRKRNAPYLDALKQGIATN